MTGYTGGKARRQSRPMRVNGNEVENEAGRRALPAKVIEELTSYCFKASA